MICTHCGHDNPADAHFCSMCGAAVQQSRPIDDTTGVFKAVTVDPSGDDLVVAVDDVEDGTAMLVVQSGPNAGYRYLLEGPTVAVGRAPECEIFLDDITVSRRHAEFTRGSGSYQVTDSDSLNGTYVNRVRIDEPTRLAGNDEVQIGKFKLRYLAASPKE